MAINKINVRSPFFVEISEANLTSATLELYIYSDLGLAGSFILNQTAINNAVSFEISDLIAGYLDANLTSFLVGSKWAEFQVTRFLSGVAQPKDASQVFIALNAYGYLKEGINPTNLGTFSNSIFYRTKNSFVYVPLFIDNDTTLIFKKGGEILSSNLYIADISSNENLPVTRSFTVNISQLFAKTYCNYFENRVIDDGGIIENRDLMKLNFNIYNDVFDGYYGADTIIIKDTASEKSYPVVVLEDTRYEPYFLTFINKFGEFQDIVFTGNDSTTLTKTNSSYKGVIKTSSGISALSRESRIYNTQMTSKITLNSGFYPESFNEIFKQLLLSEEVWVTYDNDRYAVNIETSSFTLKKDLINYTIVAEVANPIINYYR